MFMKATEISPDILEYKRRQLIIKIEKQPKSKKIGLFMLSKLFNEKKLE